MSRVRVLDCTLRDGGYCNDCHFGLANSRYLVDCLVQAGGGHHRVRLFDPEKAL